MSTAIENLARPIDLTRFNEHSECSICLGEFGAVDQVTPLPCDKRHYFHTKCIKEWARQKFHCPLCQQPFTRAQLDTYHRTFSIDFPRSELPLFDQNLVVQDQVPTAQHGGNVDEEIVNYN